MSFLGFLFLSTNSVHAFVSDFQDQTRAVAGSKGANLGEPKDPRIIAGQTVQAFLGLAGIVSIVFMVYAGFLIMTAAGSEDSITKGKTILRSGFIGLIIILSAFAITILTVRIATGQKTRPGASINVGVDINLD